MAELGGFAGTDQEKKAPEPPKDVPWDEIDGTVEIIEPANGTTIKGHVVDVRLNIATNTVESMKASRSTSRC